MPCQEALPCQGAPQGRPGPRQAHGCRSWRAPACGPAARHDLIMAPRRRAGGMARDVLVSAELSGDHSLGPDGVRKACGGIERALSGSHAPYRIRSCTGNGFSGNAAGGPGQISVDIRDSSYVVAWEAQSAFRIHDSLPGVLGSLPSAAEGVRVRASATIAQVPVTLPTIGNGTPGPKFSTLLFDLSPPKAPPGSPACHEILFGGMANPSGGGTALITLFGECVSGTVDAAVAAGYVLGALSGYCGAYSG